MIISHSGSALLLFSGGQDSAICLFWALNRFERVYTLGFDYGQLHLVEMQCRQAMLQQVASMDSPWATRLGEDKVLKLAIMRDLAGSSLVPGSLNDADGIDKPSYLPSSFVPGRNLIFLTLAAALAYKHGCEHIVSGVCETDFSGYPDCRDDTMKAMQVALNLGMQTHFVLHTPLMWLTKAQSWQMAYLEGIHGVGAGDALVSFIRRESHTCYEGERSTLHDWGYGCGRCPACLLRKKGWEEYVKACK